MPKVCLIDYGSGNVHSARKALMRVAESAHDVVLSGDPDVIASADRLVLPGVGAFAACMARLSAQDGVVDAMNEAVAKGRPFLGICVGMQLLADRGLEHGETGGLGLIGGTVRRLETGALKSPHMGWNDVRARGQRHPLLPPDGDAYFVHSFVFEPEDDAVIAATAEYGEPVPALIARGNVAGTQFHPEKSQAYGLALLSNFLEWRP
ncbi:imidazole glycerol phosphate synthase subunit HisH [Parvularcula dongshanensis]|uniref:Imidazole glycerol phosphate synthase subunit HisH n=1 Tax=Parvularcula dongshanensis TaxID=1173995 RepID=A0A840I6T4_9PROT|nr:imidazole glycerol phosphate synthase subunit HisH [Parvularcula dongshanensis]MBB4659971.1 glutamine amidotransferase [Parvularcula dongshanensis]